MHPSGLFENLPEYDFSPAALHAAFPGIGLGWSIHSIESAGVAGNSDADYLLFSPVFDPLRTGCRVNRKMKFLPPEPGFLFMPSGE
ncbi:MAG: hypothetical protein HGA23_07370 [Bacteroidales bacterium]|nr:hypothetical protein [Bacteroidales bacterium]